MKNLIKALVKATAEFEPIKKTKKGMHGSDYAPLDVCIAATKPALNKNGLVVVQPTVAEGDTLLVTKLMHESGEILESTYPLPIGSNPQHNGSAQTYARRYTYCSLLGVSSEDDDDADSSVKNGGIRSRNTGPVYQPTEKQLKEFERLCRLLYSGDDLEYCLGKGDKMDGNAISKAIGDMRAKEKNLGKV